MKALRTEQLHTLNQAGTIALNRRSSILFSIFFFLTGISTGIFLELTMDATEKGNLASFLQQYLYADYNSIDYPNPFLSSLSNNLLLLLIIFLAGLSALGFPIAIIALTYKGMALGFCTCLIIESFVDKGLIIILTSIIPQNLILIPDFILATSGAVNFGLYSFSSNNRALKKNLPKISGPYILLFCILAFAIGFACLVEALIAPAVL